MGLLMGYLPPVTRRPSPACFKLMPNQVVEKAAVHFGRLGLNEPDDVDVDEEKEEPERSTQLPDDSPVAPRASLPPSLPEARQQTPSAQANARPWRRTFNIGSDIRVPGPPTFLLWKNLRLSPLLLRHTA